MATSIMVALSLFILLPGRYIYRVLCLTHIFSCGFSPGSHYRWLRSKLLTWWHFYHLCAVNPGSTAPNLNVQLHSSSGLIFLFHIKNALTYISLLVEWWKQTLKIDAWIEKVADSGSREKTRKEPCCWDEVIAGKRNYGPLTLLGH